MEFQKVIGETLVDLAERWQDEQQYEDIKDYQKVLQTDATKFNITLTGMTSRPFGCTFTDGGFNYTLQVKLTRNNGIINLSWKPV